MFDRYKHTQTGWVTLLALGAATVLCAGLALEHDLVVVWIAAAVTGAATVLFASLTVEVDATTVSAWFGPGLIRRTMPLRRVQRVTRVRNRWWYGWGLRLVPGGWLWNVSGLEAVELQLDNGRVWRLGTDDPEGLREALERAIR